MKLHDSIIKFNIGVRKVVPPEETIDRVLNMLYRMEEPILNKYQRLKTSWKVFLYICEGTNYFKKIVKRPETSGKGFSDKLAFASALMEMVERYSCYKYLQNKRGQETISFRELEDGNFQLNDIFLNITSKNYSKGVDKSELFNFKFGFRRGSTVDGETTYLPLNFLSHSLEGTNGMSAGNSYEEALLHGIYEVIERHCMHSILNKRLKVPTIDLDSIDSSIITEIISRFTMLRQCFLIKDFSLGIGIPVIGVIRKINEKYSILTAGAASNAEEALIRALAENVQLERNPTYFMENHKVNNLLFNKNNISFQNLPNVEDINLKLEIRNVNQFLRKNKMKIFYCITTDEELDIPCLIVYISGAKFTEKEKFDSNLLSGIIYECFRLKNYEKAKYYIDKAKKIDRSQWLFYNGLIHMRSRNYEEAINCFNEILKGVAVEKFISFGLFCYGLSYLALNKKKKAAKIYERLLKGYPFFNIGFKYPDLIAEFSEIVGDIRLLSYANDLFRKLYLKYILNHIKT